MNGVFAFTFTGLTTSGVLTVLGVAGGAVVVLYLLKLRRRRVEVPFVKLWHQVLAEKQTTRLFSQLKRLLSLLIALLVVLGLATALGDPRSEGALSEGRTLVVLIDASASMQATDVEPSRLAKGIERVDALIEGLGPADRMLIAQLDATATPVSPLSGEPRVLKDALENIEPTEVAANLRAGLHLALDVLRDQPQPEVVVVSDGNLDATRFDPRVFETRLSERDVRLSWIEVGERGRNVGISAFSVRRYPLDKSQSEVLVELNNPTDEVQAIEMTLLGDGEAVDVQRLNLDPGERLRRFFRNISGVDEALEARITMVDGSHDDLQADDRAYARLPERRRARVCVVSAGNLYLQAALLLDEYLDVTEVTPENYPAEGEFDVYIFDAWAPLSPPDGASLYLAANRWEEGRGPLEITGEFETPYFDHLNRRNPLLRWTALRDVNVARAAEVRLQPGDRAIARDDRGPLIVQGARDGKRFVAFTFDVRESDLPLRVAWPMLLLNTIDTFVQEDVGFVSSFQTGDTWHVPVPAHLESVTIVDPHDAERRVPVVEGRAVFAGLRTGFHTVRMDDGTEERFAANLGAGEESHIAPAEELSVGAMAASAPTAGEIGARREIWLYLVLFVLGILSVEWWTYHRRMTV